MSAFQGTVRPSLARIVEPGEGYEQHGDHYWGSGFFIAPQWLLTCAHVVGKGGAAVWRSEQAVGVVWQGGTATGRVVLAKPRPSVPEENRSRWEVPDIALVHVPDARDAPCVWLSERPPSIPAEISLHGWSRETGDLGVRDGLGQAQAHDTRTLLLTGVLPVEGVSGGPVVDRESGAVIAVVKAVGRSEGLAVPVTALHELYDLPGGDVLHTVLREHDRHHLRRYREGGPDDWTRTQLKLRTRGAPGLTPDLRVHLYGLLAELPPPSGPGEVMELVEEVKARVLAEDFRSPIEQDPRSWREGAGLLHDLPDIRGKAKPRELDLDAVLLYAAKVARHTALTRRDTAAPQALRDLADWVTFRSEMARGPIAEEIGRALAPILNGADVAPPPTATVRESRSRARADVLVEVGEPDYGGRYPWRVKLLFDGRDVSPFDGDDRGVPRSQLRRTLRAPLAGALRQGDSGENLAAVEALLPRQLFDEPIDAWRLIPDGADDDDYDEWDPPYMPLGRRRVVVIRDRRRNARDAIPEWRRLWNAADGPLAAVPLRDEAAVSGHGPSVRRESRPAAFGRLMGAERGSVPVYCGHVEHGDGFAAMSTALAAGHPLALWRRNGQNHDDCQEFHDRAGRFLAKAGSAAGLRDRIQELRVHASTPELAADSGWADGIAVLFDPPDRPPYGAEAISPPPMDT
ncbi:trypsin-like peptidase domain-containing protein [Streptomyces sp. NPDC050844]|uniref:VMAP-C domain-containing protein n=1 Tax=Streptomyces sp. NPDC050844 TaxID=3155790 RepID=UPI0033E7BD4A